MKSELIPSNLKKISFFAGLVQGGAEKQAVETAKLLHARGHDVTFYCYNLKKAFYHPEDVISVIDIKKYTSRWPESFDKVFSIFRLARIIQKDQPDFLISYTTLLNVLNGLIGLLLSKSSKTRHVGSERNSVLRYSNNLLWTLICRTFYMGLDGLYTNNSPALEQMRRIIRIKPKYSFLLPNILDTEGFQPDPDAPSFDSQHFTILVPARICDQKNQLILAPVARRLIEYRRDVQFVLAGNPEPGYTELLKAELEKLQVDSCFTFLGQQPNMRKLYTTCDLTYLPSKFEGFSNSILEAMACEALVLGSDIPAFTDVIKDQVNGFITSLTDPDQIAKQLGQIIDLNPEKRQMIQKQARQSALAFGRDGYYQNLLKILEQVGAK